MPRTTLKRPRDAFDTSPASSTPPGNQAKAVKRYHIDSDAFSDASAFHLPSDSPSNPFGRFKTIIPRDLPTPTPVSEHLVLRFQLARQNHSVYRIATVPANYTFWHLHRLTQFLFGWKDYRKEKHPDRSLPGFQRRAEHIFTVKKRIAFHVKTNNAGLFYNGTDVVRVAGNIQELRPLCNDDIPWEREERYTLSHLWNKPGSASNSSRGVIYEYDVISYRKAIVHISLYVDADKIKSLHDAEESSNTPHVYLGTGLPDDDDDDEDFALDLQQFNESHAFENFIFSQEDASEDDEDECPSIVRLAEEQALAKRRMTGPLPDHIPLDDDPPPEVEEEDEPRMIPLLKREKNRRIAAHGISLPESREVGVHEAAVRDFSPVKKRPAAVRLSEPEDSSEVATNYGRPPKQVGVPRKRAPFAPRLPDPDESHEVDTGILRAPHKQKSHAYRVEEDLDDTVPHAPQLKRMPLEHRLPYPEESVEIGARVYPAPRKRASFPPLDRKENDALRALYAATARRRVSATARLPDPEESREIGDDRPAVPARRDSHRRTSMPPLLNMVEAQDDSHTDAPAEQLHHKRRHVPLRGVRRNIEPSIKAEEDDNDERDELAESEAEV